MGSDQVQQQVDRESDVADSQPHKVAKQLITNLEGNRWEYLRAWSAGWRKYILAGVIYLLIMIILTGMIAHSLTSNMFNESPDPNVYIYFLKWWPWAILHGHNPFLVHGLTYPNTYNAAWMTSIAGPALLATPVTLLFGPLVSWNLYMLLAPVAAALAMLWLLDTLEISTLPAILGGFLFGFSSYEAAEMRGGHIFLVLIFPIPILVALLIQRIHCKLKPALFVTLSILLVTFMLYTSTEMTLTFMLSSVGAIGLFFIWYKKEVMQHLKLLFRELLAIATGTAVLIAPLAWYLISGLKIGSTAIISAYVGSNDLLSFIIPTPATLFGSNQVISIANRFTSNYFEEGGYIGIILLIVIIFAIAEGIRQQRVGRHRWAIPLVLWTSLMAVLTLGPVLRIDGNTTPVRLPWMLAIHLPILKNIVPIRLSMYVTFSVALWVPLWVSWGIDRRAKVTRFTIALLGALLVIPNTSNFSWPTPNVPRAVSDGKLASYVGDGSGVLVLPSGSAVPFYDRHLGALWSEASNFQFNADIPPWGYDPYSSTGYNRWPASSIVASAGKPPREAVYQIEVFCAIHDDHSVAVPGMAKPWLRLMNRLGWAHHAFKGVTAYRVPEKILQGYRKVSPVVADTIFKCDRSNTRASCPTDGCMTIHSTISANPANNENSPIKRILGRETCNPLPTNPLPTNPKVASTGHIHKYFVPLRTRT